MDNKQFDVEHIYNTLCSMLTEYEDELIDGTELYNMLVELVCDISEELN